MSVSLNRRLTPSTSDMVELDQGSAAPASTLLGADDGARDSSSLDTRRLRFPLWSPSAAGVACDTLH